MKNRTFKIDDQDLIFDMLRLWNTLTPMFEGLHKDMLRNMNMLVSDLQWKPEWKAELDRVGRSTFAYNLLRKIINNIMAVELDNRKQVMAKATGTGDALMSQVVTQVMLYFLKNTKFEWQRTRLILDSIIMKFGVANFGWTYEKNPEGDLYVNAIYPGRIRFEPNYADPNWEAAGYIYDKHPMSLEQILNKYAVDDSELQERIISEAKYFFMQEDKPEKKKWLSTKLRGLFSAAFEVATGSGSNLTETRSYSEFMNWWDPSTGKFDVLELHEKRTERRMIIRDNQNPKKLYDITDAARMPDGIHFDPEIIDRTKQTYGLTREPEVNLDTVKYISAVIPAFYTVVNEQPYPWKLKGYTYKPFYCYDYHADPLRTQSVIDDLVDTQSDFNKARNLKLELLYKYVNNGWIMDENAIVGVEEDWTTNRLAPYRRVRSGYLQSIEPEKQQKVSDDLIRETQEAPVLMEHISNSGAELSGKTNNEASGKLFLAKANRQAKSFGYLLFNNNNSVVALCEDAWAIIQNNVQTQRLFRLLIDDPDSETGQKESSVVVNQKIFGVDPETNKIIIKIKNDITVGEYDFSIDQTNFASNAGDIEFASLADLFEAVLKVDVKKADDMLPYLVKAGRFPYGEQILQKWAQTAGGDPQQQQMIAMEMQLQKIMAALGIQEKKTEIEGKKLDNEKKKQEITRMAKENILGKPRKSNSSNQQKDFINSIYQN